MPAITSTAELTARLRAAIRGGTSWLLLTDEADAFAAFAAFGNGLILDGTPAAAFDYSCFAWIDAYAGRRVELSVMLVDKAKVPAAAFDPLLAALGHPPLAPGQDLIAVTNSPRRLGDFLSAVGAGAVVPTPADVRAN